MTWDRFKHSESHGTFPPRQKYAARYSAHIPLPSPCNSPYLQPVSTFGSLAACVTSSDDKREAPRPFTNCDVMLWFIYIAPY
uniref:Uncharacterized protein n=1 Tax=Knipowitschia caucasica TaxID=637954 RepID=A0AAV2KSY0_KNICA